MLISTMTQKGQVTIPAEIRRKMGFKPGNSVQFVEKNGEVKLKKPVDFFSFRGSIKSPYKFSQKLIKMEEKAAEQEAVKEYLERVKRMKN